MSIRSGVALSHTGKIIVLNGFPATGKLIITRKVSKALPCDTVRLFDNHLPIDLVLAVFPQRDEAHHELRRQVRRPIFAELSRLAQEGYTILLTACLVKHNETDGRVLQEHLDLVRGTNVPLIWVNAHCSEETSMQRVTSVERCGGGKAKLTDAHTLRNLLRNQQLVEPSKEAGDVINLIVQDLDVNGTVEASADCLMNIMKTSTSTAVDWSPPRINELAHRE